MWYVIGLVFVIMILFILLITIGKNKDSSVTEEEYKEFIKYINDKKNKK